MKERSILHYVVQTPPIKIECACCLVPISDRYVFEYKEEISVSKYSARLGYNRFPEEFVDFLKYRGGEKYRTDVFSCNGRATVCLRCFLNISRWLHEDLEEGGSLVSSIERRGSIAEKVVYTLNEPKQVKSARNT